MPIGLSGSSGHHQPWLSLGSPSGLPPPACSPGPRVTPMGAIGPCPSDVTAGPVSSSPQPCSPCPWAQPWLGRYVVPKAGTTLVPPASPGWGFGQALASCPGAAPVVLAPNPKGAAALAVPCQELKDLNHEAWGANEPNPILVFKRKGEEGPPS